jgi:hypothetical protein
MARGLILLLVCMNLAAALWWALHAAPAAVAPAPANGDLPGLRLLSEVEARNPGVAELQAAPEDLADFGLCLSLGPFDTPAALRAAVDALAPQAGRLQMRQEQIESVRGYRVFLPPAESHEAALARVRELDARGVRDVYVVTAGAEVDSVSLGLFRDEANAERRRAEVAALGFAPVVEPRVEPAPQWWVDVSLRADFDWRALPALRDRQARPLDCPG